MKIGSGLLTGKRAMLLFFTVAMGIVVGKRMYASFTEGSSVGHGLSNGVAEEISGMETCPFVKISAIPVTSSGNVDLGGMNYLTSSVEGTVVSVNSKLVFASAEVEKGEVICSLDDSEYRKQLAEQQKENRRDETKYTDFSASEGQDPEFEKNSELDNHVQLKSEIIKTESSISATEQNIKSTAIKAPYSGTIYSMFVKEGSRLKQGDSICAVYSEDLRSLTVPVPLELMAFIKRSEGERNVQARLFHPSLPCYEWKGILREVHEEVNDRDMTVDLTFDIAGNQSYPDFFVYPPVNMPIAVEMAISLAGEMYYIPARALRDGSYVWAVAEDGRLMKRPVKVIGSYSNGLVVHGGTVEAKDLLCVSISGSPKEGSQVMQPEGERK